jgi:ureidoglycolate hydrolase
MSAPSARPYEISLVEHHPEGTTTELFAGRASAFVIAVCAEAGGELRIFTDHGGPTSQRRRAIRSLTEHIRKTIGLGR